ncbi:hypothetical protein [uncultured Desulfobacter sp.]|uniref:O-antigen ligase family protein n=1 Tax=uncultured Desulfobacter sp. TaxID=240139 RepID=UPI002AA74524|nr:hypothetical protein [uncultured Desulfobacter sp.]
MIGTILSCYLALTIVFCFFRIKIGIAMFLFYSLLVPKIVFFSFGPNLFNFFILLALFLNYKYKNFVFKPLAPFIFLYLAQFIIIPFHNAVPYGIQLNAFRVDFMAIILLPFAIINVANRNVDALDLFNKVLMSAVIVAVVYSLFLATMLPGSNPYIKLINPGYSTTIMDHYSNYCAAEGTGRLFGRISGVFIHPMQNGLFLSLGFVFLLSKIDFDQEFKDKILVFIIFFTSLAILCIGIRTPIGALGLGLAVFLFLERKVKLFLIGILSGTALFIIIQKFPGMGEYIASIFDKSSKAVEGSSFELRLFQLNGCLKEISHNYLFGKGYNWTSYYLRLYAAHPTMFAFESLVLVILCNNGFIGGVIWALMIFIYIQKMYRTFSNKHYRNIMITLMVVYLVYIVITGDYGYMKFFLIFYAVMFMWPNGLKSFASK